MASTPTLEEVKTQKEISSGNLVVRRFSNEYKSPMLRPLRLDYKLASACGTRKSGEEYFDKKPCYADVWDETDNKWVKEHSAINLKHFRELRDCYRGRLQAYIYYNTANWPLNPDGSIRALTTDEVRQNSTHLYELEMAIISMIRCANCYSRRRARPSSFRIDKAIDDANNQIRAYWRPYGGLPPQIQLISHVDKIKKSGFQRSCPVEIVNPKPRFVRLPSTITNLNEDSLKEWKSQYDTKIKELRGTRKGKLKNAEKVIARNFANQHIHTMRAIQAKKNAIQTFKTKVKTMAPNLSILRNATTQRKKPAQVVYNRVKSTLNETQQTALPAYNRITQENQTLHPGEQTVKNIVKALLNNTRTLSTRRKNNNNN